MKKHLKSSILNVASSKLSRRDVLKRSFVLGLAGIGTTSLLAACEFDDSGVDGADESDDESVDDDDADDTDEAAEDEPDDDDTDQEEHVIRPRIIHDIDTIDPAYINSPPEHGIAYLIYSGLVQYEVGGLEPVPDLATDWDISDDGVTYTFHLRDGVQWHKGYGDLTADDVVFTYERIMNPDTQATWFTDLTSAIESLEAVDDLTVEITLLEPFAPFLTSIVAWRPGWILNQEAVEERGDDYGVDPIGTGPYMWESRTRGSEVILLKNPDYRDPVDIDVVRMQVITEDNVAELAMETGEIDVSYFFDGESITRMLADTPEGIEFVQLPGFRTQYAGFNLERPAVEDIRVRQAIIHAINKEDAAMAVYGDAGTAVSSIFNPNLPSYLDPDPFPYDPDRARELLAEAGYEDGLDIVILPMPAIQWPDLATVFQDQWAQVGINAELIVRERAVYDELVPEGDYDINGTNLTRAEEFQYAAYFDSGNIPSPNFHRYEGADDMIRAAAQEVDDEARIDLWHDFQEKVFVEDVVGFGVTNVRYLLAWREGFGNVDTVYQDSFPNEQVTVNS